MVKKSVKKTITKARATMPEVRISEVAMSAKKDFTKYYTPVMVVLLIVAAFYIGRLSAKVDGLQKGVAGTDTTAPAPQAAAPERKLDVASLKERAKKLGLDSSKFDQCLDSGKLAERVSNEQKEGAALGVSGTPSFFINGVLVVGAQPQSSFESVIDAELKNGTGDKAAIALGEEGKRVKLNQGSGYVRGANNAKIKIVEYTDFECPFCERSFPTMSAIEEKYKGKISLEYKSFPLSFHPSAQKAAEAALCAGEQGKFWEMHDDLFASAK
ncbi:MAG: DSBA oxidoreductase family protein [Candidatus Collierbacteria bacterium GW2011_GWB1_44_6]|uniref:DSBA oxidoreductase family protein n=1 Tax=Candidatus Collierbacteria bacterium GW2011_GWB1_44_6 TaxID=1618384 RepID=A0A0G1MJS6_9BACT|nr:MAG: DSBA oxidoreductase family protein [Candidatus Collierbacteria bacterium GW2011_GWB1_44_6]